MEVAGATSPPTRSSMRRSTPGMGEGVQSSRPACTAARSEKSALSSIVPSSGSGVRDAGTRGDALAPSPQVRKVVGHVHRDELNLVGQSLLGERDADAGRVREALEVVDPE